MGASTRARSVVLLSGGLDSAANLALCSVHDEPVLALTVDYGQRALVREVRAAAELAAHYRVEHRVMELRWLGALGGSALTDSTRDVPQLERRELDDPGVTRGSAAAVWVPNRNGVLLNVAAALAEARGATRVVVGFNREEAATFPDNSTEFLDCVTQALAYSTANRVTAYCYTDRLNKQEIVARLLREAPSFPFGAVWSCYHGAESACGTCESCGRLRRALEANGVTV
ncbi:MAG: 7-cyano-7-deazaguanine synthase QueC [Bdellovibrionales bacterium]|nr:7-cyano-7-deazaguanine synthase QueC [Bdellovibrionales bacterium]